jgi:3-deoxy-D-manno-octulosonic-acid transferase
MISLYDIAYGLGVAASSPYWAINPSARHKVLTAFSQRMGDVARRDSSQPAILIHAVSLGEINTTRALVDALHKEQPDLHLIISTTTKTGYERGQQIYSNLPHVTLIRFPLDFTGAISRVLDRLRPNLVVLMELEVWPNFMKQCQKRKIPVILANGRLTTSSFRHYRMIKPITASMFGKLARVCAQDETYAQRFEALGVPRERIVVTGTMKFDTAQIAERVDGDSELANAVRLHPGGEPIWLCGSTGPGEEDIVIEVYRDLLKEAPNLRLVIVPRHPERFDDVANLIAKAGFNLLRRSSTNNQPPATHQSPAVILGDTMGELRKFYSLATVVFVGRSLVDLGPRQHGSDMIEPAALAKPIVIGPYTANFDQAVRVLKSASAVIEVTDGQSLKRSIHRLLSTPSEASAMGQRAQQVVKSQQGATQRHIQLILENPALRAK